MTRRDSDRVGYGNDAFSRLLAEVRACRLCVDHLEDGPNPVLQASPSARVLIAGQAPGRRVHESGVPFDDPSGERLRAWMGVDRAVFYSEKIAILPMGFCFPGSGRSGDLPPRPECADTWRTRLLHELGDVRLTLVIGRYAMAWHLRDRRGVTEIVTDWPRYAPTIVPLPHPSPRNRRWFAKNPWFEEEVVPHLRRRVAAALTEDG